VNTVRRIYRLLLGAYGAQGWWPVTDPGACRPRYSGGPKSAAQRFEVMVGAVLTQNTAWKNVEKALAALHESGLVDARCLQRVSHERLAAAIRSSGYYNEKAKKLKALAAFLRAHPVPALLAASAEELRPALLAVHGVGPETADSILLYALGKPVFVVDAYTKRIFSRLGLAAPSARYAELQQLFHGNLERDAALFNEYHALIVEHGKNTCSRKPACETCVLRRLCAQEFSLPATAAVAQPAAGALRSGHGAPDPNRRRRPRRP